MVLLVGLVAVVAITTIAIGLSAVDQTTDSASVQQAETAMDQFAQGTSSGSGSNAAAFPEDGQAYVDADAGSITVSVGDETVLNRSQGRLGTLYFESADGTTLAYQGGGVWRDDGAGESTVQTPPPIQYGNRSHATLVLPVRTLETEDGPVDGSDVGTLETESVFPVSGASVSNPITDPVTVTVQSEFYEAWGSHFEQRFGAEKVTYDHDAQRVTVELEGGEITYEPVDTDPDENETEYRERIEGMVVNDGSELTVSEDLSVDSYNSSEGPYDPDTSGPAGGDVRTIGDFNPSNGAEIHGDVNATGRAELSNDVVVHGALTVGGVGEQSALSGGTVHGPVSVRGDAELEGQGIVAGDDLYVGGATENVAGTIEGDVHLHEATKLGGGSDPTTVEGGVYAIADDEFVLADATVAGDVYVIGDASLEPGTADHQIEGDLHATGAVTGDRERVAGRIYENASIPGPASPRDPNVTVSEPDVDVDGRIANASADTENDNENASAINQGGRLRSCSPCELTAGSYYLPELRINGRGQQLVLNTTDGPIDLHVDDDVTIANGATLEVEYANDSEHPARVYADGDFAFEGRGGAIQIAGDRTPLFQVYTQPDATFRTDEGAVFRGAVYGLSDGDERTNVELSGGSGTEIYGAFLGDVQEFDQIGEVHYDESLGDRELSREDGGPSDPERSRELELEDADVSYLYLDREPVAVE